MYTVCMYSNVCNTYRLFLNDGSGKATALRGAGPDSLSTSGSKQSGHRTLIRQTEFALVLVGEHYLNLVVL